MLLQVFEYFGGFPSFMYDIRDELCFTDVELLRDNMQNGLALVQSLDHEEI